jgi:4-hydroxybenzoate polyprenyltransferase
MKYFLLLLRMLRYRVAVMLIMFFMLGCASHNRIPNLTYPFILASIALLASYITATTINDIADKDIDAINHPKTKGRPLITGEATVRDLYTVHLIALSLSLLAAVFIGFKAIIIIAVSLAINYIYSAYPFRLSYRTFFAPLILSVAYVVVPYLLGLTIMNEQLRVFDLYFVAALFTLFCGRILLKDFRDRKGDAAYGKPTLILKYGKKVTCITSLSFILIGNILLFFALHLNFTLSLLFMALFLAIYYSEYRLWKADSTHTEQVMIGIGAKMGNGLLLMTLGLFIIQAYHGTAGYQLAFVFILAVVYVINFIVLIINPDKAILGYKG